MARQSAPAIPVLVTRPQAEGAAFVVSLSARFGTGVRPILAPLLAPRILEPRIPDQSYAAVIFTSAHAVTAARQLGLSMPRRAWCVGRKTAEVATAAGFDAVSADGDADSLSEAILADPPNGRILYLRGVDTHGNLLEKLNSSGVESDVAIVYAQDSQPLTPDAIAVLSAPTDLIVPLFSPRTAALFRAALPPDNSARLHFAAMSAAVAKPLAGLPHAALVLAARPDAAAMLDAVETLLAGLAVP